MRRLDRPLVALLALGVLAAVQQWIGAHRPDPTGAAASADFAVTSEADSGPGSLREAIFAADRAADRARIRILAPLVRLDNALPPLANPRGVVIEAGPAGATIDGGGIGDAAVLDVDAPGSVIAGIDIAGAGRGIVVRARGAAIRDVSVSGAAFGIVAADGANGLIVERCRLAGNGIGVTVDAGALPVRIEASAFRDHRDAGVWSVAAGPGPPSGPALTVRGNTFTGDRIGAVLGDVPAEVADNRFAEAGETGLHLIGGGVRVRNNHVASAGRFGILAERTTAATLIEGNEVRASAAVGILARTARGTAIRDNRLHGNAYGIVDVLGDRELPALVEGNLLISHRIDGLVVIGGAPLVRRNRVLRSRGAALRSLDLIAAGGARTPAAALLAGNEFEGNGVDREERGEYRLEPAVAEDGS